MFYLGSRCSQIFKNFSRRSAEGLSLAMFGCAIAANITYGLGILLRTYSWHYLRASAPWILGSLGTVFLDVLIFCQVQALHASPLSYIIMQSTAQEGDFCKEFRKPWLVLYSHGFPQAEHVSRAAPRSSGGLVQFCSASCCA